MAQKDVGIGWGDLNGSLREWFCPLCSKNYPIADWAIVQGDRMDGRKCPSCEFSAFQHNETRAMVPQ